MKKVLLIAPLSEEYSGIRNYGVPSLGVHRLSSYLNAHGHYCEVYDCNIHGKIEPYLEKEKWDIIGISILNNTLALSLELFLRLEKEYPDVLLVCGNAEAIVNYSDVFDNTNVNIVVLGEGELPMLDICNDKPLGEIKGLILRNRSVEINDNLLWDYYKDIDFIKQGWRDYWAKNRQEQENDKEHEKNVVRLVTSSHCNRNCSFCSLTKLHEFSCGSRVKPAMLNTDQIKFLINRIITQIPETTHVYFVEDSILPKKSRIDEFCDALKSFSHLKYFVQSETDKLDYDIVKKLSESNVVHITCGVENCSPRIRKLMGKPQNEQNIENIISWCYEFNIRCYYLIILFDPNVIIDDLIINYETLTKWQHDKRLTVSVEPFMMPYRQARIWYQDFDFEYEFKTLSNHKILKQPTIIYPKNKQARELMMEFRKLIPEYMKAFEEESGHIHKSKDHTGKIYIKLLGDLLKQKKYI